MGQKAGIPLRETVLAQQSALRPLLTCQHGCVHSLLGRNWPMQERTVSELHLAYIASQGGGGEGCVCVYVCVQD